MAESYGDILEAERAKYPEIEGNWPESVEIGGEHFEVLYGLDGDREIEGFVLIDGHGEELFPVDLSVIYLTGEHIWEIITWEYGQIFPFRIRTERERQLYSEIRAEHNRLKELKTDG